MSTTAADLRSVIDRHSHALAKPGVLSVRPGYKVKNDWLTDTPSIVVTVEHKVKHLSQDQMLPSVIDGVPVDVRQATPEKRKELANPTGFAGDLRLSPDLGSVPHFPDERTLSGVRPAATASAHAALARAVAKKPELDYTPADGVPLNAVQADATIQISASPDSGWKMLKSFLEGTRASLTVGLYDFTSAHIEAAIAGSLADKQMTLVLDHPAKNPTADQTDVQTVAELHTALGGGFDQAWALTRPDPEADAWIFPTAYHIKVAVRDHSAVWLSSGNWNNSNQPEIDPASSEADAETARHRDRDWHVIVEEPQLANIFEQYILHDKTIAAAHNLTPGTVGPPLPPPVLGSTKTAQFARFFDSATITGTMKIAPLLTPDPGVYAGAVKELIESATQSLYMQFQYIELPKPGATDAQGFIDLVQAVIDRQNAGIDVRIIMSEFEKVGYLEQLHLMGLNVVTNVKIQNNVHNKGIVVDGKVVLVSSQNWSTDGTLYNRDAGVIIHNEAAAAYFQEIFLHDWDNLAVQKAPPD
jgi:PLD-like domain